MTRNMLKLIRQGEYVAEIEVELNDEPEGWGPYLSLADAERLDQVRSALSKGDLVGASQLARVYRLTPIKATA
ncbi:MAG: hypothetical protein HZA51_00305 [Planctomycetes bacterium]|nr:hypothetical protein [Planctomycetota bacterium]